MRNGEKIHGFVKEWKPPPHQQRVKHEIKQSKDGGDCASKNQVFFPVSPAISGKRDVTDSWEIIHYSQWGPEGRGRGGGQEGGG